MTNGKNDIIENAAKFILEKASARNVPLQGTAGAGDPRGMPTFAQFEDDLDAHFDAYYKGELSRKHLKEFLASYGFTKSMIRAEIKQQNAVYSFKRASEDRNKADAANHRKR